MTTFRASKGYHFSADGTEATTWANFQHVRGSEPAAYEFTTEDRKHIAALRKLIDERVEGYTDIVEVAETPAGKAGKAGGKAGGKGGGPSTAGGSGGDTGVGGSGGTSDEAVADGDQNGQ